MDSRPWYVSFTAILQEAEGFEKLRRICHDLLDNIPFHHVPVKGEYWHFTVLPLFRAIKWPVDTPAEEFIFNLLKHLERTLPMGTIELPEFSVQAYEAVAFDSGTCIQFSGVENSLDKLREKLRDLTEEEVHRFVTNHDGLVSELDPPSRKNKGNESYGSIARALTHEANSIRWRREIGSAATLRFSRIYLLVSDEYLSNPYAHDDRRRRPISLQGK